MRHWVLLAIAVSALLSVSCGTQGADAAETGCDGTVYTYETHGSAHPDYYCVITGVETDVSILHSPAVLEGYDVRIIASGAFDGCMMESVILPRNLEVIEAGAFTGCPALKDAYLMGDRPVMEGAFPAGVVMHSIPGSGGWGDAEPIEVIAEGGVEYAILPDGAAVIGGTPAGGKLVVKGEVGGHDVVSIDHYAFAGTMTPDGTVDRRSDISSVILPEGLESIGQRAFYYNDLEEADLPPSVRYVQDEAFRACYGLLDAEFPPNLTYIGFEAFRDCRSLTELTIPNTVGYIGGGAFYICDGLRSVRVDTDISQRMFGWCTSLEEADLGRGVHAIGDMGFYRCESLVSVEMPEGVSEVSPEAFRDCISLEQLDLGDAERIGRSAFRGCESLVSLDLPAAISSLGGYCFADCIGLSDIYAHGSAPDGDATAFLNVDATLHCGKGDIDSWESGGYGLEVRADLGGGGSNLMIAAIVIAIAAVIAASLVLWRRRRPICVRDLWGQGRCTYPCEDATVSSNTSSDNCCRLSAIPIDDA